MRVPSFNKKGYCSNAGYCNTQRNSDCSICVYNPNNSIKELQRAGRSYTPAIIE